MNIAEISKLCTKPELYTPSTATMWTDPYISGNLLKIHLDTEIDLGSRKEKSINRTIEWIVNRARGEELKIAELGCGPGLYAEKFAQRGHHVTGVDFSKTSIDYARKSSEEKRLAIEYRHENYLDLSLQENSFDLVTLIYTDFGVLFPEEQNRLLSNIFRILKTDGLFIFDIINDRTIEGKLSPKSWECALTGFWRDEPYIALSDSFLYKEENIILFQHVVITEHEAAAIYRFWTHLFSTEKLQHLLEHQSFRILEFNDKVLPGTGAWDGENVTFVVAQKC